MPAAVLAERVERQPPDAFVEAQRGVIREEADRLPVYQRLLDQYRRDLLREAKAPEPGSTIAHLVVTFAWAGEGEDQKALRQDLARRIAHWYVARRDLHGARRWIDRGLASGGPPTVFTAALQSSAGASDSRTPGTTTTGRPRSTTPCAAGSPAQAAARAARVASSRW